MDPLHAHWITAGSMAAWACCTHFERQVRIWHAQEQGSTLLFLDLDMVVIGSRKLLKDSFVGGNSSNEHAAPLLAASTADSVSPAKS
jgi:hypothetical protein